MMEEEGIRPTDPRLKQFMVRVSKEKDDVDEDTLDEVIDTDLPLIASTLRNLLVIPDFRSFCSHLDQIFEECTDITSGNVASYIPELSKVSPNFWGMSVCTVDGQRYSKGDSTEPFTLQSCSKPLTYGLALQQLGSEKVHQFVGQEPSGEVFNALILDKHDMPHNPMINPGAIIMCGLLKSLNLAANEYVGFSNEVYESEKATGFRNCAIAYLMMEKKCFPPSITVDDVLTLYYKSCSILGNCETLSVIAATLANGGVCPLTNKMVLRQDVVQNMLSLMQSCGMYDYSGHFAFQIGLPAKSGVSGGMMLVVPSVMGIGLWSPPLDRLGNSCRCLYFCERLLDFYCMHPYARLGHAVPAREDPTQRPGRDKEEHVIRILCAAARDDVDALQCYFLRNMDMNVRDYDGRSALHVAASEGHLESVRFLIDVCRVDVNARDRFGHTPRKDAEEFGNVYIANVLKCIGAEL
ncbi:hypothetical protein R5R35_005554 [Gryllus longicercus]|uniref:glutaminase n=1 Tax=Gryllus longicercus TaxID=2509291 RepID=A0AAN9W305_9ORTH